jgi:intracellular sulfur oxidation DsrE/DsrF family protein
LKIDGLFFTYATSFLIEAPGFSIQTMGNSWLEALMKQESRMRNRIKIYLMCGLTVVLGAVFSTSSMAQEEKPFAEQKFVLQISDMDPSKQTLVLNVAGNIIKHYGQDKADVEIVAFGPGLRLLFEENSNAGRIEGLSSSGVRFAACANTITNMSKITGHEPELGEYSTVVPGGIVRIKELVDLGYVLVKP